MSTFTLRILTPDNEVYSGDVEYLSVEAEDGRVGFMRGALPRIDFIKAGVIEIKSQAVNERFFCDDGIISVNSDGVVILTSVCGNENAAPSDEKSYAGDSNEFKYAKAKIVSAIRNAKANNGVNDD